MIWNDNDIPYVKSETGHFFHIEWIKIKDLLQLMAQILKVYDVKIDYRTSTFIDKQQEINSIIISESCNAGNLLHYGYAEWRVYKIFDLDMYVINNKKIDKMLIMFLIDPLKFINIMRQNIDKSQAKNFFDSVEYYIIQKLYSQTAKYYVLKCLAQQESIVNDIVFTVLNIWVQLEVAQSDDM